jgi:hypothetical protein
VGTTWYATAPTAAAPEPKDMALTNTDMPATPATPAPTDTPATPAPTDTPATPAPTDMPTTPATPSPSATPAA